MQTNLLSHQISLIGQQHDPSIPGQNTNSLIKEGPIETLPLLPLSSLHLRRFCQNLIK